MGKFHSEAREASLLRILFASYYLHCFKTRTVGTLENRPLNGEALKGDVMMY